MCTRGLVCLARGLVLLVVELQCNLQCPLYWVVWWFTHQPPSCGRRVHLTSVGGSLLSGASYHHRNRVGDCLWGKMKQWVVSPLLFTLFFFPCLMCIYSSVPPSLSSQPYSFLSSPVSLFLHHVPNALNVSSSGFKPLKSCEGLVFLLVDSMCPGTCLSRGEGAPLNPPQTVRFCL